MHNGIFGVYKDREGIFESERNSGFRFRDWEVLEQRIYRKKSEVKIARYSGLEEKDGLSINNFLADNVGKIKYDYQSFLGLVFDAIIRRLQFHKHNQSSKKWTCTEVIDESFRKIGIYLLNGEIPSPYSVEELLFSGKLSAVADFY